MAECPCCEGSGCEECDGTGRCYRRSWTTDDGIEISVSGSGAFRPELMALFEDVAQAAKVHLTRLDKEEA